MSEQLTDFDLAATERRTEERYREHQIDYERHRRDYPTLDLPSPYHQAIVDAHALLCALRASREQVRVLREALERFLTAKEQLNAAELAWRDSRSCGKGWVIREKRHLVVMAADDLAAAQIGLSAALAATAAPSGQEAGE